MDENENIEDELLEEAETASSEDSSLEEQHDLKREIVDFAKLVVWFLVIFLGLKYAVIEGYEVQGDSMLPNLQTNDRILVFKLPHQLSKLPLLNRISPFEAGDVVVFDSPDVKNKRYVKRVIALGPNAKPNTAEAQIETDAHSVSVEFNYGKVYVNNRIVEEEYLSEENRKISEEHQLVLGPDEFYVLGDNRRVSKDSRSFDAVQDQSIIGKAVFRFWPINRISLIH